MRTIRLCKPGQGIGMVTEFNGFCIGCEAPQQNEHHQQKVGAPGEKDLPERNGADRVCRALPLSGSSSYLYGPAASRT